MSNRASIRFAVDLLEILLLLAKIALLLAQLNQH